MGSLRVLLLHNCMGYTNFNFGAKSYNQNLLSITGEGSQFDYTVNTLRARALANGQISNVVLTFRVDSIAQEPNETFTLTLVPLVAPNPREGLFFQSSIQVTIRDSDSKENYQIYTIILVNAFIVRVKIWFNQEYYEYMHLIDIDAILVKMV